jgi:aminopeptidase N
MFDSRAYPKGAWVVHMLRRRLGDEQFWQVINRYTADFAHQSVETVDLRKTAEQMTGRSFERFFHDWTERPGHPELSVATKWLADDGMVQVKLRQKQEAAAFHFPLAIEFRTDGRDPVTVTREMTTKELTLYQPLDAAPMMVRVDPEQAVLMELEETKGRDLWETQLRGDPSANGRIDAAVHFGESRVKGDHQLLADALAEEPFWGVQVEIAKALAKAGGDIARDALVAGLALEDARARRQCAQELRSFESDDVVITALRPIVAEGDPSYRVEAAAIESYAALKADDARRLLEQALDRDSRREEIRSAALSGLGRLGDPDVVPILVAWTKPEKPRLSRPSAVSALGRVTRESQLSDEAWDQVIETLSETLDDTGRWVRSAAVSSLGNLGEPARARSAIGKLRTVAANDDSDRLRTRAERTIEAIQKGTPANAQVDDLRAEVKELLEENKHLSERLEKLEGRLNGQD